MKTIKIFTIMAVAGAAVFGCAKENVAEQAALAMSLVESAKPAEPVDETEAILKRFEQKTEAMKQTAEGKRDLEQNAGLIALDEFLNGMPQQKRINRAHEFAKKNNASPKSEERLVTISKCTQADNCPEIYDISNEYKPSSAKCPAIGWGCVTIAGVYYLGPEFWTAAVICAWAQGYLGVVTSCGFVSIGGTTF